MFKRVQKKRLVIILSIISLFLIVVVLSNYINPNIEASIQHKYTRVENVEVLQTDWYGNKGLTFFVYTRSSYNEELFCKGHVSKNIFNTETSMEGCVPNSNSENEGAKQGVYGTSEFFGKPMVSGFNLANSEVKVQGKEVKTIIYKDLKAWYIFSPPAEPTFGLDK
ncbi:hypothetical protein RJD24_08015 [Bacillaceae bacterium IKA-2]|nr:hypothetical protein RJD24_08015 [Bacillaceae bacterium IKA-2]